MEKDMEMPERPVKVPRVAVCLTCSNEWMARDGSQKKPARCPECKSRNVAWRDEQSPKADELTEEPFPEVEIPEEEEEITGYIDEWEEEIPEEEPTLEAIAKRTPRINPIGLIFVIGGLTAAGLVFFLLRKGKGQGKISRGIRQKQAESVNPGTIYQEPNLYGGYY